MRLAEIKKFIYFYLKSMRLYYCFITGISGWVGVAFYDFCMRQNYSFKSAFIIMLLFLAWGTNQVINDFLGLPEDRINAPNRPMVTGELNIKWSLIISAVSILFMLVISWFLNPWSTIPIIVGVGFNVLYEYAKAWSLLGNLVYGISISMCTVYGFLASGPLPENVITCNRISVLVIIVIANGLMAYFSYFKDYDGDKAAGKKTFHVRHGLKLAGYVGVLGISLPLLVFLLCLYKKWLPWNEVLYHETFIFCGTVAMLLEIWTAMRFFYYPRGVQHYLSLITNAQACVAVHVTIIAIFNGPLALYLMIASYIFIDFLFGLYKDAKS
jgi:geranylgeranylglycerol-phosphate geranylgeranyltransferase